MPGRTAALLVAALVAIVPAAGGTAAEVSRVVTVAADPAAAWRQLGPFCAIADWHPGVASCREERDAAGSVRRVLTTRSGREFVERLIARDDPARRTVYVIEASPLPVEGYEASLTVAEADGGRARVTWHAVFTARPGVSTEEAERIVSGMFEAGLQGIARRLGP